LPYSLKLLLLAVGAATTVLAQQAQQTPTGGPAATQADAELSIVVLQGQGAIHNIVSGSVTEPVVEVRDAFAKPVPGAEVTFELPASGAGGSFPGHKTVLMMRTTAAGQAGAMGFVPNQTQGPFMIQVTARQGNRIAKTIIRQQNSVRTSSSELRAKGDRSGVWKVLVAVGSAAATGAVFALVRGSGGSGSSGSAAVAPTNTIAVSPGSISITPPR
jgi:hypothetical protein